MGKGTNKKGGFGMPHRLRITIPAAIKMCAAHGDDIRDALTACEAHGHKVVRAFQSGTGVRFDVDGVKPDVGTFGLKRLVEGWKK